MFTIFLESGGQFWALEDCWTQVGVATGHSASIADFNWSLMRISVSNFDFLWDFIVILMFYHLVNLCALKLLFVRNFFCLGKNGFCVFVSGSSSSLFRVFDETSSYSITARESVFAGIYEN